MRKRAIEVLVYAIPIAGLIGLLSGYIAEALVFACLCMLAGIAISE